MIRTATRWRSWAWSRRPYDGQRAQHRQRSADASRARVRLAALQHQRPRVVRKPAGGIGVRQRTIWSTASLVLIFVALGVTGCAKVPTLTPSELNAHPDQYDGKAVHVGGWLSLYFEDYGLWDSRRAHDTERSWAPPWPMSCVSVTPDVMAKVQKPLSRPAMVDGIFRKHILPSNVISNGICNDTGLEVTNICAPTS